MKKIMITYASYGGGHLSAARNIKEYIEENYKDCEIYLFDGMRYINKVIDKVCNKTYQTITKDMPWFWGKLYYNTQDQLFEKITSLSTKILSYKLRKIIREFEPDIIISTHFFLSHMCSILKQKGKINAKLATIITDYGNDPYSEWIANHKYVDFIFVAHNKMKEELIKKGVSENKIFDTGIPVSSKFLTNHNKEEIYKNLNFEENKKTILFFGGGELGLGKSKTLEIFKTIITNYSNLQITVIAGKNETLKENFEKIAKEENNNNNIKILGFTTEVAKLMSISNLVITKPGGLTTTECLVSNSPIIAINPIPGQETENAEFIEKTGIGIYIQKSDNLKNILDNILTKDDILMRYKNNCKKIAKPNSTHDICKIILN